MKEARLVGSQIRAGGICMGGGKCLKNLKRGGAEKRGGNTKILKRGGGKLSEGVGLSHHFYGMLCAAPLNNINQMIKHY